jgi:hypothetical protein
MPHLLMSTLLILNQKCIGSAITMHCCVSVFDAVAVIVIVIRIVVATIVLMKWIKLEEIMQFHCLVYRDMMVYCLKH